MTSCCPKAETNTTSVDLDGPEPVPLEERVFFFGGDLGLAGAEQDVIADRFLSMDLEVDAGLFAGDNNYPIGEQATLVPNWKAFFNGPTIYPALGNHDLDTGDGQPQLNLFPNLPGNRRYFQADLGVADLFVLNSGRRTDGVIAEPDDVTIGSDQYQWFVDAIGSSCRPWRIVMFHHPFITETSGGGERVLEAT